jgi:hypothetical protein
VYGIVFEQSSIGHLRRSSTVVTNGGRPNRCGLAPDGHLRAIVQILRRIQ